MGMLVLGLYAEGSTDHDFLPPIIRRTADLVLTQYNQGEIDVQVFSVKLAIDQERSSEDGILHAARHASGYHALVVHTDADAPTAKKALDERYYPGHKRVQMASGRICKQLIPIIPIHTIEAWILADHRALLAEIGTDRRARDLGIPERARLVESISKPKERLKEAVVRAYAERSKRQQGIDLSFLYEPMGNNIDLRRLDSVPSYQKFKEDLTETLIELNVIYRMYRW